MRSESDELIDFSTFMSLQKVIEWLGAYEFLPPLNFFKLMGQQVCRDKSSLVAVCESVLFLITGFNERSFNTVNSDVQFNHFWNRIQKLKYFLFFSDFDADIHGTYTGRCCHKSVATLSSSCTFGTILSIRLGFKTRKYAQTWQRNTAGLQSSECCKSRDSTLFGQRLAKFTH